MNKKAVLLIHGLGGTPNDFGRLPNDLKSNYDVYTFILPGHDKKKIKEVTKEDWLNKSENELKIIINKNYKEIYIIGHSMGGVIASYLATKYKEVTKLILASPAYKYQNSKDLTIKEGIKLLKEYPLNKIISSITKVSKSTFNEFKNLVIEHQKDINNIICPALILWGKNDRIVSESIINNVYNNIKKATLFKINNVDHSIFINDRYKEIKDIIISFLNNENNIKKETQI